MAVLCMSSSTGVLAMCRCQPSTLHGQTRLGGSDLTVDGPPSVVSRMSFFLKSGVQASSAAMNCPKVSTTSSKRTFSRETHPRPHHHGFRPCINHVSITPRTNPAETNSPSANAAATPLPSTTPPAATTTTPLPANSRSTISPTSGTRLTTPAPPVPTAN